MRIHELLHDPALPPRRVVLAAVDRFLATSNLALALRNLEFAVQDVLEAELAFLKPPLWRKGLGLADNFLENGRSRLRSDRNRSDRGSDGRAKRANYRRGRRRRQNTTGSASKKLGFTAGNISLADRDMALALDELLGALGRENAPDTLGLGRVGVRRSAADRRKTTIRRKGKHDGQDGQNQGKHKEECRRRDGPVVVVAARRAALTLPFTLAFAIALANIPVAVAFAVFSVGGRGLGHPDADRVRGRQGCGVRVGA